MSKMVRIEIISNQSVESDITELLEEYVPDIEYTVFPVVHGKGKRAKKLGDSVWPEQNFAMVVYTNEESACRIQTVVTKVKEKFPNEGISFFKMVSEI